MTTPSKEGTDPNIAQETELQKRGSPPQSTSPTKARKQRRMSMRNRRVSFAPDPELTMVHTFEKDDDQQPSPATITVGCADNDGGGDDMDITVPMPSTRGRRSMGPGEITAAIGSLAALAEEDELLNKSEDGQQAGKWGFVPGDDDTMDVDLEGHGRMFMGDTTHVRMYNDVTVSLAAPYPSDEEERHPALYNSPDNVTNSSMNTENSTRRLSRQSISSGGPLVIVQEEEEEEDTGDILTDAHETAAAAAAAQEHISSSPPPPQFFTLHSTTTGTTANLLRTGGTAVSTANAGTTHLLQESPVLATPNSFQSKQPINNESLTKLSKRLSVSQVGSLPPPGSAIAARYPGSAVATGRLSSGFTPSGVPSITFADFAKIVEVQFLDNLRRGASLNYADLQPNTVPSNINEALTLLAIISPQVTELETAIHTLQSETTRLRSSASELEVALGTSNPPIFRHVQRATRDQLDVFRANVGLLRRVCRSKAVALLKDLRCQMEESKAARLTRAVKGIEEDVDLVKRHARFAEQLKQAAQIVAEKTALECESRREKIKVEAQSRRSVVASREALELAQQENEARRNRLAQVQAAVVAARDQHERLTETMSAVQAALQQQTSVLLPTSHAAACGEEEKQHAREQVSRVRCLQRVLGIDSIETAGGGGSLSLWVGGADCRLQVSKTGCVAQGKLPRRLCAIERACGAVSGHAVCAAQMLLTRLLRVASVRNQLEGVFWKSRQLSGVELSPSGDRITMYFIGLTGDLGWSAHVVLGGPGFTQIECVMVGDGEDSALHSRLTESLCGAGKPLAEVAACIGRLLGNNDKTLVFQAQYGNPLYGQSM